jgi:signal transduction histidine kinase
VTEEELERIEREHRMLILAPTGKDAALLRTSLEDAGVQAVVAEAIEDLVARIDEGAGAVLLAEEALADGGAQRLGAVLRRQPPWSDLPILLLTMHGADSPLVAHAVQALGNVQLLERPTRIAALTSAARAALRGRGRQYQLRTYLSDRERAEEGMREASRRKDEFLALLAHELRNPLAPIRSSLEVLRITSAGDASTEHVREMMERQVDHLVRLVDDLMEVSRITRGKVELREEPLDVIAVVRSAMEASEPLLEQHRHHLHLDVPAEPLVVVGDPVRLVQVLGNLLNNAAKFTPPEGDIWLNARRQDGAVVVTLRDSGAGIPPDALPHVFEMFMQGHRARVQSHAGLGLGLTLVRSLVELHGGTVEARSDGPGKGSEFVVKLPAATDVALPVRTEAAAPPSLAAEKILVVDDNVDAAQALATLLQLLGADVRTCDGGAKALEAMRERPPHVAFVDIGMPDMDGYEVARRVKADAALRGVMLVALTGWGQEEDRRRSREAGFDHHLIKPTNLAALKALLVGP